MPQHSIEGTPHRSRRPRRGERRAALVESLRRRLGIVGGPAAVAVMDIDQFGQLSTFHGFEAGNGILEAVMERLQAWAATAEGCDVFRLEGDRFAAVTPTDPAALDGLMTALREPIAVGSGKVRITASIGVAVFPEDAHAPEGLIKNAGIAVNAAKRAGRDCYRYYKPEMWLDFTVDATIRQQAEEGLEKGEFMLFYQPVVDIRTGQARLAGFEALLRWQHPERGVLGPGAFEPAMVDDRFAARVGEFVATAAVGQAAAWQDAGVAFGTIAINAHGADLRSGRFVGTLLSAIRGHGLRSRHFRIEITEGVLLGREGERMHSVLEQMHHAGLHLSLDDFGTGFASLSHLQTFPVDAIKLDKSYVTGLDRDYRKRAIARGIIDIAHSIGLGVVAEGVETVEDLLELGRINCDEVQGFLFARPMAAPNVAPYVTAFAGSRPLNAKSLPLHLAALARSGRDAPPDGRFD